MASCSRCGAAAPEGDSFCTPCRTEIETAAADPVCEYGYGGEGKWYSTRSGKTIRFEAALALSGGAGDHARLEMENPDRVRPAGSRLVFHPVYVTEYRVGEKFHAPDGTEYEHEASGVCYTDAESGRMILMTHPKWDREDWEYGGYENVITARDLTERPAVAVEVSTDDFPVIEEMHADADVKKCEDEVRGLASHACEQQIMWEGRDGDGVVQTHRYLHMPRHGSIRCSTAVVHVPKLHIDFVSAGLLYTRVVLMSSGVRIRDDLSECQEHLLGVEGDGDPDEACDDYAETVCTRCGMALCTAHAVREKDGRYWCRLHAGGGRR